MRFNPSIVAVSLLLVKIVSSVYCLSVLVSLISRLYGAGSCWHRFSSVCSEVSKPAFLSQSLVVVSTVDNASSRVPVDSVISFFQFSDMFRLYRHDISRITGARK